MRAKVAELRGHQRAIQAASLRQGEGWRQEVVSARRRIAIALGELGVMTAGRPSFEGMEPFRRTISNLRASLAEHQALWPAIAIVPTQPAYIASVGRVRESYRRMDVALSAVRSSRHP